MQRTYFTAVTLAVIGCGSSGGTASEATEQAAATLPPGTYRFETLTTSGECVDVSGAGSADGTNVQQWACTDSGQQWFRMEDLGDGSLRIINTSTGKCMDVAGAGKADGTNIQLWTCNGTPGQAFTLLDGGNGQVAIRNPNSGKCVDVAGSG